MYNNKKPKERDARDILKARREGREDKNKQERSRDRSRDKNDRNDNRRGGRKGNNNENHRRKDLYKNHVNPKPPRGYPDPLIHRGKNTETFEPDYEKFEKQVKIS